jgi:predicted ArsR family transcriptional regulator
VTADTLARERIAAILKQSPRQSAADIAQQAGVSRQRVHQILHELGYELTVSYVWRKRPKGGKA